MSSPSAASSSSAASAAPAAAKADPIASALGKRKAAGGDWMGRPGDGGASAAGAVHAKLQSHETAAKLSSIKSKLSKPKADASAPTRAEDVRRKALSREEILANQQRHSEKLRATGKAVPHYRKS